MSSTNFGTNPKADNLTKREYFAAKAMEGILSGNPELSGMDTDDAQEAIVYTSIQFADKLVEELNK